MNYIHALESKVGELSLKLERAEAQVLSLKHYCMSDKFAGHANNFVNPSDIITRINDNILPEFTAL